ncbi:MAG TPA: hypothetical protein PKC79_12495 [Solidesulfovibrio magneticus]|nr:hypothetical protein [Solidesulfovibrio magneticus]
MQFINKIIFGKYDGPAQECLSYLESWANYQFELERRGMKKIASDDQETIWLLGRALFNINVFNQKLLHLLNSRYSILFEDGKSPNDRRLYDIYIYMSYHTDLLISRIKHFFFKETPNKQLNEIFFTPEEKVYQIAKKLLLKILQGERQFSEKHYVELQMLVASYFFYLQTIYEFIYKKDQRVGVFLSFEYNKERAIKTLTTIKNTLNIEKCTTERMLRENLNTLLPNMLDSYMSENTSHLANVARYGFFVEKYIQQFDSQNKFEPMTWRLASILYNIDEQLQDAQDYQWVKCNFGMGFELSDKTNFISEIKTFVSEYEKFIEKSYANPSKDLNFSTLFTIESKLINRIWSYGLRNEALCCIHSSRYIDSQINVFKECCEEYFDKIECNKQLFNIDDITLVEELEGLQTAIGGNADKLKLNNLLTKLTKESLFTLLFRFFELIKSEYSKAEEKDLKISLVGFSVPGLFLAHLYNLFTGDMLQKVWFFRFYSYISIQPRHYHLPADTHDSRPLLLDESVKTAFTSSIYSAYLHNVDETLEFALCSLFNFTKYKKVYDVMSGLRSLYDVGEKNIQKKFSINSLASFINIPDIVLDDVSLPIFLNKYYLKKLPKKKEGFDTNLLLTNTLFVVARCNYFKEMILKYLSKDKTEVYIFSPSLEGEFYAALTVFLLRLNDVKVTLNKSILSEVHNPSRLYVHIDVCLYTGFTLEKQISYTTEGTVQHLSDHFKRNNGCPSAQRIFDLHLYAMQSCKESSDAS